MNEYLNELNTAQREAVEYCDGPSLVIAGAGSGKTRVLTYKIAHLMHSGFEPWRILALTFTNKAAGEMKKRIAQIVGDEAARFLWMGTFHSIFLRILRYEHDAIGFSSTFTIYDTADSKSLVKAIIKEMGLDDKAYKPGSVLSRISNAKNQLVTAHEYVDNVNNRQVDAQQKMPALGDIFLRYSQRLKQADAMDFDDILLFTFHLFDKHEEIRQKYAQRFGYVLVDEYQDTNSAQHRIVWQLAQEHQHVCVVGDDAQSIYSFRGANIDNILTFQKVYENSRLFKLEQNYRSTQTIVNAANSLITHNSRQIHKEVFSENEPGDCIVVSEAYSDVEEGKIVAQQIRDYRRRDNVPYSSFAILYRTNAQSRIFEDEFRRQNFPYRIFGGLSFYQRKEIKDVIAYLRLAVNPHDEEAMKRVINYPARGIGNTTLQKIIVASVDNNVSLWMVINDPFKYGVSISKGTMGKLSQFCGTIQKFIDKASTESIDVLGPEIMRESGIIADIYQDATPENKARQENIEELASAMVDFVQTRREEGNNNTLISDYLSEVSLLSDVDTDKGNDEDRITLMTVHSAKGLEFANVFVVGMEENLFPSQMAGGSPREMEEERRLFYVAITRAERRCFLSYAKSRYRFGNMEYSNPSRFIAEIAPQYLKRQSSGRANTNSVRYTDEVELPWMRRRQAPSFFESQDATVAKPAAQKPVQNMVPPTPALRRLNKVENVVACGGSSSASTPVTEFRVGQKVSHQRFGEGVVKEISGSGDNLKVTVDFVNCATRQLLVKFAKLQAL